MFSGFLAIVDIRTIYRDHASMPRLSQVGGHCPRGSTGSTVKWCLNEKVELLCKLAMPHLSSGV